jgi:hypothetical protein
VWWQPNPPQRGWKPGLSFSSTQYSYHLLEWGSLWYNSSSCILWKHNSNSVRTQIITTTIACLSLTLVKIKTYNCFIH